MEDKQLIIKKNIEYPQQDKFKKKQNIQIIVVKELKKKTKIFKADNEKRQIAAKK